jgi:hypothetical protein
MPSEESEKVSDLNLTPSDPLCVIPEGSKESYAKLIAQFVIYIPELHKARPSPDVGPYSMPEVEL